MPQTAPSPIGASQPLPPVATEVDAASLMGDIMDDALDAADAAPVRRLSSGGGGSPGDSADFALRLQLQEYEELERTLPEDLRPAVDLDPRTRLQMLREIADSQFMFQQEQGIRDLINTSGLSSGLSSGAAGDGGGADADDEDLALARRLQQEEMLGDGAEAAEGDADDDEPMDDGDQGVNVAAVVAEILAESRAHPGGFSGAALMQLVQTRLATLGLRQPANAAGLAEADVDGMSYEELLQLGERIGKVNTALSPDAIAKCTTKHVWRDGLMEVAGVQGDATCTICMTEFENGEEIRLLGCNHAFHLSCIDTWLLESKKCPVCKKEANASPAPVRQKSAAQAASPAPASPYAPPAPSAATSTGDDFMRTDAPPATASPFLANPSAAAGTTTTPADSVQAEQCPSVDVSTVDRGMGAQNSAEPRTAESREARRERRRAAAAAAAAAPYAPTAGAFGVTDPTAGSGSVGGVRKGYSAAAPGAAAGGRAAGASARWRQQQQRSGGGPRPMPMLLR